MPTKKRRPARIQLPRHPVDALVKIARLGGWEDRLDPEFLKQSRAYCDELVPASEAVTSYTYTAAKAGALGGAATSPAKRRAVKANGKLGGRPKGAKDSYPRKRRKA